jgi:hypothetical protein
MAEAIDNKREGMAGIYSFEKWDGTDTVLDRTTRGIIVGTAGVLSIRCVDQDAVAVTDTIPAGLYPMWIDEIDADLTTAANITFVF